MKITHNITIAGQPIPLKRHRHFWSKGKQVQIDPQKSKKDDFAWKCRAECDGNVKPIDNMFSLHASFYVSSKRVTRELDGEFRKERPDLDNYLKFVLDALQGSFWIEDSHCVYITSLKFHSKKARTELIIEEL